MLRFNVEQFTISRIERGMGFHNRGRAYDKARFVALCFAFISRTDVFIIFSFFHYTD